MDAENKEESYLQKDSAEHEGYVGARRSFNQIWKERDSAQPELLEKILHKDNLNRAFKRVKANKGAPSPRATQSAASWRGSGPQKCRSRPFR